MMETLRHKSGNYTADRGGYVSLEGENTLSLDLLLKGRLDIYITPSDTPPGTLSGAADATAAYLEQKSYRLFDVEQNIFIGINDLFGSGKNSFTITAAADCSLYAYAAGNADEAMALINNQKDYGAYFINSLCSLIVDSYRALQKTHSFFSMVSGIYRNLCIYCAALAEEHNLDMVPGEILKTGKSGLDILKNQNITVPAYFSAQFIEDHDHGHDHDGGIFPESSEIYGKIEYYSHLLGIPTDIKKSFFAADRYVTKSHIADASECLGQILQNIRRVLSCLEKIIGLMYGDNDENVYAAFISAVKQMRASNLDFSPAVEAASYVVEKLKSISGHIGLEYRHNTGIDFKYLDHEHASFISILKSNPEKEDAASISVKAEMTPDLPEEITDSAVKILEYAQIPEEKATRFMSNLTAFRNLNDRLASSEPARNIRSAITELYFEIYHAVFKKAYLEKDNSRLIKMFLSYGYMDEKILDNRQTIAIYKLAGMEQPVSPGIYYMPEWLGKIYSMEKTPSINSFGNDYHDTFRELKRQGKLTDKDKPAYDRDSEGRLAFEINNMFRLNHRLCHGQIALYFPILHKDMAPYNPVRSFVNPAIIQEKLNNILKIDYSAFHRDIHYRNPERGIEKEIISVKVMPDIILVPVYGTRAMMWQEIAGRLRNTPGRLMLPVFTDENLDDMLIKLVGNFRWELCRTMMGAAWNNITQPSLTSEYADYIQFYRKNRELSEEAKQKIKALITKHHNKLRDIFTSDYDIWINNESKGNPRLNKVARSIFFKYCPFSKEVREQLEKQTVYTDLIATAKFQKSKQVRELESRYKHYIKSNGDLDPELRKNLEFHRDM
jgi:hypothetical protein